MKFLLSLLIVIVLVIASCKKDHGGEDNGCIRRVYSVTDHAINNADVPTVDNLFSKNHLNNIGFRYIEYSHTVLAQPPYPDRDEKDVVVETFDRGLRILNNNRYYEFVNDLYTTPPEDLNRAPANSYTSRLDTTPKLSLPQVRKVYRQYLEKNNSTPIDYTDTCFTAEFGFFLYKPERLSPTKPYRVWLVKRDNSVNEPKFYVDDDTEKQLVF